MGLSLARDELSFFPFLYWPITLGQQALSSEELSKLNRYLKGGGMILFDTRDSDIARVGQTTKEGRVLQQLASGLNLPPLAPIAPDHVLTRSFYLVRHADDRRLDRLNRFAAELSEGVRREVARLEALT